MIEYIIDSYLVNPTHPVSIELIGAGGNGSQMLTNLAKLDKSLQAFDHPGLDVNVSDPDTVTHANIGRQLFSESDIGQYKANVLITRINRFFGLNWTASIHREYKPEANIIISCVDNVESRKRIYDNFFKEKQISANQYKKFLWMDLGNSNFTGQFVVGSIDGVMPTIMDKYGGDLKEDTNEPSCSLAEALERQDLFINPVLTNLASNWLWNLFRLYKTDYHGLFVNLRTMQMQKIPL